ncbi:MAG TPA: zinc-binding dehydrogenase [Nocardioidaceae bacterium]
MRAAVIESHGRPPVLVGKEAPVRGTGEALVRVTAAPITPLDVLCATGTSYFGAQPLPYVPGVQGVGVVEESAVHPAGTRVWFPTTAGMRPGDGSMAAFAVADDADVVPLTEEAVADTTVAALGLSAVAAWMCLTWRAGVREGEQVLVLGAGGVVGQVAVQAARLLGARRVVAACRSAAAQDRARGCGADAVVELRDGDGVDDLRTRLSAALDGPVDVVVDPLFGVPATAAARLLGEGGRLVNLGSSAGATAELDSAHLRSHTASVLGYTNNGITREQRADALTSVLQHTDAGRIGVTHEVVPLEQVADAWARQTAGSAQGRLVVAVG